MFQGHCQVVNAGPTVGGQTEIKLKPLDGSFPENFFLSKPNVSREVLATALAAITSNRVVFCEIPDQTKAYSELTRILL